MRTLDFGVASGEQIYELLYDGVVNTNKWLEAPAETRIMGHILDKLESVGVPAERGGLKTFSLRPIAVDGTTSRKVELESVEYEMMRLALKEVRWTARAARLSTVALEFFHAAGGAE